MGDAADVLRGVYDASDGADGFVSIEVEPDLADDTAATLERARQLWRRLSRPNLLVNLTNDSWFMGSSAAEKHFFVGAMRALENGRYFVQSALYGVTGVVDPEGRVVARTGPEEVKTLEVTVYPIKMKTWFTRIGLWRFPIFALMTAIYLGISSLATRRSRSVTRS